MERLSAIMPDAWPVFFRQRRPLPIQVEAMPAIVRGESVLVCGPTASGKTEAAVAPIYQRHVSFRRPTLSVVYVAPTKALVNDLYFRLTDYLGINAPGAIQRYTGDHHDFRPSDASFLLLTTPEALDSLQLMRPESLLGVRVIVVDEIHLLHGNARGQQLRYVIQRIRQRSLAPKSSKDTFQMVGMTATIDDIDAVGKLWVGDIAKSIVAGEARRIDMSYLQVPGNKSAELPVSRAERIAKWLEETGTGKVLIFGNTRNNTHALAAALHQKLKKTKWPVFLHIGILSASERERVESAMKAGSFGVCVATSSLEVGIDIGDIDAIVLADPPYSVSSFLQRIGRGNRRSEICKVVALYENELEERIFKALLQCASNGILDDVHEYDRPSVRFQQVLSLAWRRTRMDDPLTEKNITKWSGGFDHADVISDMSQTGALQDIRGALVPADDLMDEGDARRIHSVISGSRGMPMIDIATGDIHAYLTYSQLEEGLFYTGGKIKTVTTSTDGILYLETPKVGKKARLAVLPSSRGKHGLSRCLVWAIAESSGHDPSKWVFDKNNLLTWGGSEFNNLLAIIFKEENIADHLKPDSYGVSGLNWHRGINPGLVSEWTQKVRSLNRMSAKMATQFREPTRYIRRLSPELQAMEAFNAVPFDNFLKWLDQCKSGIQ